MVDETSSLHIIDEHGEVLTSFALDAPMLDSLKGYLRACSETTYHAQIRTSLGAAMEAAIQQILPYHLRRPSDAQISYAVGIAKALEIVVPPEVLSQRWAIHEFLDANVPVYKSKQTLESSKKVEPRSGRAKCKGSAGGDPQQQGDFKTRGSFE